MRATHLHGTGDVRVIDVPDPTIQRPTDALVRVLSACVCSSDLHPYHSSPVSTDGASMGREFIGMVEQTGAEVTTVSTGDFVIAPFAVSCGRGEFCRARLLAVLSAKQLGAERIVLRGRHEARTDLGCEYGATDVVAERGEKGIATVRDLTDGGSSIVLEGVGHLPVYQQAVGFGSLFGPNITLTGGPAAVRAYVEQLLPAVPDRSVEPGKVFDRTVSLEETPKVCAATDERTALKVLVRR